METDPTDPPVATSPVATSPVATSPVATYRLQLTPEQDLDRAAELVPYLADLGVSHLYLSPLFEAVPGSTHGYDGTDPTRVREELGGRAALDRLRTTLDEHGLGLLLDVVPNHLAADPAGPWWWELLRDGPEAASASTFDVFWEGGPSRPAGKVLLPILGQPIDEVLVAGDLVVAEGPEGPELHYFEHRLPLRAGSSPAVVAAPGEPPDLVGLLALLHHQHYRLVHWKAAADELGYRRFFDITGLVGLRVEDPKIFDRTYALVLDLWQEGVVQGMRLDHVDGLADPAGHLARLAEATDGGWTVVEKILGQDEHLRSEWSVDGTTGYEGGALIGSVLVDPSGADALLALHRRTTGEARTWEEVAQEAKVDVLERLFRPEHDRIAELLATALASAGLSPAGLEEPDPELVRAAIGAVIVSFDVYRTYPAPHGPMGVEDAFRLRQAVTLARGRLPFVADLVDRIEALLLAGDGGGEGLEARTRLAQLTGPVMAKGIEDTALYRWVPLVGAGDVGAAPWPLGCEVADFHERAAALTAWPTSLVATSTHDSKRSADVRARLLLLSEVADEWADLAERWSGPVEVDGRTRLLLWQTLVGAWPVDEQRVQAYLLKAVREAKVRTSWIDPQEEYEQAVARLVSSTFADPTRLAEVAAFADRLLEPGRRVGLATTLLHLTLPGVPDIYQGNELWRLDLTDPDNRREVSWDRRRVLLRIAAEASVMDVWPEQVDGLPKLWLLHRALEVRRAHPDDLAGAHAPVLAVGEAADHVVAFRRGDGVVVVVPRFPLRLEQEGGWRGTSLVLPEGDWSNVLGDGAPCSGEIVVADLLDLFPVALLVRHDGGPG